MSYLRLGGKIILSLSGAYRNGVQGCVLDTDGLEVAPVAD
jgi:hypothetical protein